MKTKLLIASMIIVFAFPIIVRADSFVLYDELKKNAVMDNEASDFVTSETGIDFSVVSSDTNGKGLYILSSSKDETYPIVYYRGNISNNHIIYAGFCWQIIRTTDTGGIKVLYAGVPNDGKCNNEKENLTIGKTEYNDSNVDKKYGWMYNLSDGDVNETDSSAKIYLDNWFKNNMLDHVKELEDTIWCNDRTLVDGVFDTRTRLENGKPTLECRNKDDSFTVFSNKGNKKLTYPTAIINADELTYAGEVLKKTQVDTFVNISYSYWSMTPYVNNKNMYPNSKGMLNMYTFTYNAAIRPMVSLRNTASFNKGNGTKDNPYTIEVEKQYRLIPDEYLTVSKEEAEEADTITITPKDRTGLKYVNTKIYDLDDNELEVSITNNKFKMPAQDIKLVSNYRVLKDFYNLTTTNDNITIEESSVEEEQPATFTINVPHGYKVTSVTLKDETDNNLDITISNDNNTYTFEMPNKNVIVDATIEELPKYEADGESITLSNNEYYENDEVSFKVNNKSGYTIKEVYLVDAGGNRLNIPVNKSNGLYKFIMPNANVQIEVTYEEIINNPNTADNIYVSVIMLMLSISLLSCEVICLSKVIPRKNK